MVSVASWERWVCMLGRCKSWSSISYCIHLLNKCVCHLILWWTWPCHTLKIPSWVSLSIKYYSYCRVQVVSRLCSVNQFCGSYSIFKFGHSSLCIPFYGTWLILLSTLQVMESVCWTDIYQHKPTEMYIDLHQYFLSRKVFEFWGWSVSLCV